MIVHQEPKGGMEAFQEAPLYDTHRAELHEILLRRAVELGAVVSLCGGGGGGAEPWLTAGRVAFAGQAGLPGAILC